MSRLKTFGVWLWCFFSVAEVLNYCTVLFVSAGIRRMLLLFWFCSSGLILAVQKYEIYTKVKCVNNIFNSYYNVTSHDNRT